MTADEGDVKLVPRPTPRAKPNAKPNKVPLATTTRLASCLRSPGRYVDRDFPTLGLQVSPKKKAVWFVRFRTPDGREHRATLKGRATVGPGDNVLTFGRDQALAWAEKEMLEISKTEERRSEEAADAIYSTLAGVWDIFLRDRRTRKGLPLSATTKADYAKWYRLALQPVKDWRLDEVRVVRWTAFLEEVRSKHGDSKALYMLNILSGVYSFLMGLDMVDANPMTKVRLRRLFIAPPKKSESIQTVRLQDFFKGIDSELQRRNSREAVRLLLLTGMRLSAGLGMRWEQLNLEEGYYFVEPGQAGWKGFTGVFPLSDTVVELLEARRARLRPASPYVFPKRHGRGGPPHLSKVADALKKICASCSLPPLCAQDLRRTFASVASVKFGRDTNKVGLLLAHKWAVDEQGGVIARDAITKRYIQNELVTLRAIANDCATFIMEVAGAKPISNISKELLRAAGHDVNEIKLIQLGDEDEEEPLPLAA